MRRKVKKKKVLYREREREKKRKEVLSSRRMQLIRNF